MFRCIISQTLHETGICIPTYWGGICQSIGLSFAGSNAMAEVPAFFPLLFWLDQHEVDPDEARPEVTRPGSENKWHVTWSSMSECLIGFSGISTIFHMFRRVRSALQSVGSAARIQLCSTGRTTCISLPTNRVSVERCFCPSGTMFLGGTSRCFGQKFLQGVRGGLVRPIQPWGIPMELLV